MSLKAYIRDRKSPIAEFLRSQFPNDRSFLADARKQVRQAATIRPVADVRWDIIGMAFDYRLRYYFAVTPYEELVAYKGARLFTEAQSEPLLGDLAYHWTGRRTDPIEIYDKNTGKVIYNYLAERSGGWSSIDPDHKLFFKAHELGSMVANGEIADSASAGAPLKLEFREFFDSLSRITQDNSPIGRKLPEDMEDELNRHCVVLALMKEAIRASRVSNVLAKGRYVDTRALIAIPKAHWIDDLRELSWKFCEEYGHLASLTSVLNPSFDGSRHVGGADADLIVDGTLIDIKCTIKSEIRADWLRQVLGYVLLDHSDRYRITGIGIYMARQGLLFQWDLEEALEKLCPGTPPTIAELRAQFKKVTASLPHSRESSLLRVRK